MSCAIVPQDATLGFNCGTLNLVEKPIVNHGWITVPDKPGLGVTLNEDVVRRQLVPGTGYFEPTPQWDHIKSWDRTWS